MKKRVLAIALSAALMVSAFVGCGSSPAKDTGSTAQPQSTGQSQTQAGKPAEMKGKLVVWTYFDGVKGMADMFMAKNPDVKMEVQVFPGDQYVTKIRSVLQSGQNVPDVFDLEEAYVGKFVDNAALADLSAMGGDELVKNYVPYVTSLGKDKNGKLRAISENTGPGGFWYNRKSAKEYLGTDNPDEVSQLLSSWDNILKLSDQVIQKSGGKVHLLGHYIDALKIEAPARKPFIQEGKFSIDPSWDQVIDIMRQIRAKNLDAKLDPWSPAWGSAINDGSVIAWAMPSWAGFFIDNKDGKAKGTLGIAKAPKAYFEGATMRCIYSKSPNKDLAFQFIKYLASSEFQLENLNKTGNMPANMDVYKQNLDTYTHPMFGDQKLLKTYYDIVTKIPNTPEDKYTRDVQNMFGSVLNTAIVNNKTNDQIYDEFRKKVANAYPEVQMDK